MTNRVGIIIIVGLLCLNMVNHYVWGKRYEGLKTELTTMTQSRQDEMGKIYDRLDDLCSRLSKVEKGLKEASSSDIPFKIVDDDG